MRKEDGITLVALVITVIVLLILATVSINLVINNGILDKVKTAVDKYNEEEELEQIKLAVFSAQMQGKGIFTTESLNTELQSNLNDKTSTAKKIGNNWYYKEYVIDENGNVEKYDKLLPKEYQQVEYIESTGTQYIDTGYVFTSSNTMVKVKFKDKDSIFAKVLFGTGSDSQHGYNVLFGDAMYVGDYANYNFNLSTNVLYDMEVKTYEDGRCIYKLNNETVFDGTYSTSINNTYSMYLFNQNPINSRIRSSQIYYFLLYDNDTLVRNYIPCKRKSDNKPGLYDTVEGKFYTNQGSGEDFKAGPDV